MPFAITIDITIREINSKQQIRFLIEEIPNIMLNLCNKTILWSNLYNI